jgi:hypothetical protein
VGPGAGGSARRLTMEGELKNVYALRETIMSDTSTPAPRTKPGWKTTEFWLTLLSTLLGGLMASGLVCTDHDSATALEVCKIGGELMVILSTLGYTGARTFAKASDSPKPDAPPSP